MTLEDDDDFEDDSEEFEDEEVLPGELPFDEEDEEEDDFWDWDDEDDEDFEDGFVEVEPVGPEPPAYRWALGFAILLVFTVVAWYFFNDLFHPSVPLQ